MQKRTLRFIMLIMTCVVAMAMQAEVKNRAYYISLNDNDNFNGVPETEIEVTLGDNEAGTYIAKVNLGAFKPQGTVKFTVLSILPESERAAAGCDGYCVVGGVNTMRTSAVSDDGPTFASKKYIEGSDAGNMAYYDPDNLSTPLSTADYDKFELTIPMYIRTVSSWPANTNLQYKTFKVVGVDYRALAYARNTRIILPSSVTYIDARITPVIDEETGGIVPVTYINTRSMSYTGGRDRSEPLSLAFHDGGSKATDDIGTTIERDYTTANWKSLNNIESIGDNAFIYCHYADLARIFVPEKLKELGKGSFSNSQELTAISFAKCTNGEFDGLIPEECFAYGEKIASVNLEKATNLGLKAFYHNSLLTSVTFGSTVEEMDEWVFGECDINNPEFTGTTRLTAIEDFCFYKNTHMTRCTLPTSVTKVDNGAFKECGFTGRFDIPSHLQTIGTEAYYGCNISHVYIPEGTELTEMGHFVFYPDNDLIVEVPHTSPPNILAQDGYPFPNDDDHFVDTGFAKKGHRLRIVTPIGCADEYVHAEESMWGLYHHNEYRTKFNLTKTYTKPNYGSQKPDGSYREAPWYIASSAWGDKLYYNDIYVFKPEHGGTVDTWTSVASTNQMGETVKLYTATVDYGFEKSTKYSGDNTEKTEAHVMPRTAHFYYNNAEGDNIPKIATLEVKDGIVPPKEAILLSYTNAAEYLVPLYDDHDFLAGVSYPIARRFNIYVNSNSKTIEQYIQPSANEIGGRMHVRNGVTQTKEQTENYLAMVEADGGWVDFREQTGAPIREFYEWYADGTRSSLPIAFAMDEINPYEKITLNSGGTLNRFELYIGTSGRGDERCAAHYRIYKFKDGESIDWVRAAIEGWDYLKTVMEPNGTLRCTFGHHRRDYFAAGFSSLGASDGKGDNAAYWIDILNLRTQTEQNSENMAHFYQNHKDNGNVLVPCVTPRYVYPYWKTVSLTEDQYESYKNNPDETISRQYDIAERHDQNGDGTWTVTKKYVQGQTSIPTIKDGLDGFVSFGLSNGCFVTTKNAGYTAANRSYFRVHTDYLHEMHFSSNESKPAVIVDINDVEGIGDLPTDIRHISGNANAHVDTWYTIDGRKLSKPATLPKGIYIHNGKKVVVH